MPIENLWKPSKTNNKDINYSIIVHKPITEIFLRFLNYKIKELYRYKIQYNVPIKWEYDNEKITLKFDSETTLLEINCTKSPVFNLLSKEKNYDQTRCGHHILNITIDAIKSYLVLILNNHYGFTQFYPFNGKWVPSPFFFNLSPISKDQQIRMFKEDKLRFMCFLKHIVDFCERTNYNQKYHMKLRSIKKFKEEFSEIKIDEIYDEPDFVLSLLEHFSSETEHFHYLEVLTEAEIFEEQKSVVAFKLKKILDPSRVLLELKELKHPLLSIMKALDVYSIWVNSHEDSHIIPVVQLSEKENELFDPTKRNNRLIKGDWINFDHNKSLAVIKVESASAVPDKGYLSPFNVGQIELIKRKRKFIQKFVNSKMHSYLFKNKKNNQISDYSLDQEIFIQNIINKPGIYVIQGPPGTGKTYFASKLVKIFYDRHPHSRILISSKEHQALDHLLNSIIRKFHDNKEEVSFFRSLSTYGVSRVNNVPPQSLLVNIVKEIQDQPWKKEYTYLLKQLPLNEDKYDFLIEKLIIESIPLVFATTMDGIMKELVDSRGFDLIVVEESGKCYPSEILHLLSMSNRIVLIGDQNQLPPFKLKETINNLRFIEEISLNKIPDKKKKKLEEIYGLEITKLFNFYSERKRPLQKDEIDWIHPFKKLFELLPKRNKLLLNAQYRLPPKLSKIISKIFYNEEFEIKRKNSKQLNLPEEFSDTLVWFDIPHVTKNKKAGESSLLSGSYLNNFEKQVIKDVLLKIKLGREKKSMNNKTSKLDLVIITPYNAQKNNFLSDKKFMEIFSSVSKHEFNGIHTVDEFQGREADIVIISLVRNNDLSSSFSWGFIVSPERLNVMFSRTRSHLFIVGSIEHITRNGGNEKIKYLYEFLEEFRKVGKIIPFE